MKNAKILCALAEQYNLLAVYVFGSHADEVAAWVRGNANVEVTHPDSDVDIGVLPAHGHRLTAHDRVRLMLALEDSLDVARATESYLRRCLEALLDLARHTLAKGFRRAPAEYRSITRELQSALFV